MRRPIRPASCLMCLLSLAAGPIQAATTGDGLKLAADSADWSRWQARLSVVSTPLTSSALSSGQLQLGSVGAARLAGDRYFNVGRIGDGGGLRATSALLLGSRTLALSAPSAYGQAPVQWRPSAMQGLADPAVDSFATPYLGLGYSAWWSRAGLGFSADLGLMAQRPGQALSVLNAGGGLDNTVRAMQLSPVFQLNLSYSF